MAHLLLQVVADLQLHQAEVDPLHLRVVEALLQLQVDQLLLAVADLPHLQGVDQEVHPPPEVDPEELQAVVELEAGQEALSLPRL